MVRPLQDTECLTEYRVMHYIYYLRREISVYVRYQPLLSQASNLPLACCDTLITILDAIVKFPMPWASFKATLVPYFRYTLGERPIPRSDTSDH